MSCSQSSVAALPGQMQSKQLHVCSLRFEVEQWRSEHWHLQGMYNPGDGLCYALIWVLLRQQYSGRDTCMDLQGVGIPNKSL